MVSICNVCDGTDFSINAGFYYCDNCGNRITVLQEIESQTFATDPFNESVKIQKHKIKGKEEKAKKVELTTWEIYNYIIYGTVNGLICLGCKDELSVTTLQLWSYYLSRHEVAFFGNKETDLPKMSLGFKIRDLNILNNIPIKKKRKRSISSKSNRSIQMVTQRQKKLAASRTRKSLATSQYEEYMSSQKSDISSVGYNLSQPSSTAASSADESETSVKIKFSQMTRRRAKRKMTREHMLLHQNDVGKKLRCHNHRTNEEDKLGRPFVYAIIWLALNHIEDDLQLSDLIRFGMESHIKINNVSSYFPSNIDMKQAMFLYRQGGRDHQKYLSLRKKAYEIARTIRLRQLKMPDLGRLCERYCKELCLPPVIAEMTKKLIAFYPPRMRMSRRGTIQGAAPNFEGRAMAYIIFIFKLIFGLDDDREIEMSQKAQKVNEKMSELEIKRPSLFVWADWKHYIEMRRFFLSKCHFPTAFHNNPNDHHPVDLYVEFVKQANEDNMFNELYKRKEMENIRSIFEQIGKLHKSSNENSNNSRHFAPSLTPYSSYFAQTLTDEPLVNNLSIPDYMHVRHDEYDIFSYVRPIKLKRAFESLNHRLEVYQIEHNKNVEFKPFSFDINFFQKISFRFLFDLTSDEWKRELKIKEKDRQQEYESQRQKYNKFAKAMADLHIDRLREKEMKAFKEKHKTMRSNENKWTTDKTNKAISDTISEIPSYKYFDEDGKDIVDDILLDAPRRNLDFQPTILDYSSSEETNSSSDEETPLSSLCDEKSIDFLVSNFNYWISMESISHLTIVRSSFLQKLKKLPKNFQWLLHECSSHLHMEKVDLYIELLAIESQFRYKLKPTFKMNNCYRYRDTAKLSKELEYAVHVLDTIW